MKGEVIYKYEEYEVCVIEQKMIWNVLAEEQHGRTVEKPKWSYL